MLEVKTTLIVLQTTSSEGSQDDIEPASSEEEQINAHSSHDDPEPLTTCPSNIAGYDKVVKLAHFLFGFKDTIQLALNTKQANMLINLWDQLDPFDQRRTEYPSRHQRYLHKGRFKVSKTPVLEGVDSTKRYVIAFYVQYKAIQVLVMIDIRIK